MEYSLPSLLSHFKPLLALAFKEDLDSDDEGAFQDLTTAAIVKATKDRLVQAKLVARENLVLCGLPLLQHLFNQCAQLTPHFKEGDWVRAGAKLLTLRGAFSQLLKRERIALNFLGRLSGIATHTRSFTMLLAEGKTRLLDTRKTTPGYRFLEKYAVHIGGGSNHRFGLYDAVLIKENHIQAAGGVAAALAAVLPLAANTKIEIECRTLAEVKVAATVLVAQRQAGLFRFTPRVMLDNFSLPQIKATLHWLATAGVRAQLEVEASGNVDQARLKLLAPLALDFISCGQLTHSAPTSDVSFLVEKKA